MSIDTSTVQISLLDNTMPNDQFERLAAALCTLWRASVWGGPCKPGGGLAFPPGPHSIERARTEPDTVKILALESEGGVVTGGCVLHLGDSIGPYATAQKDVLARLGSPVPAFIRSLAVLSAERGKGYGSLMLKSALGIAAESGATAVAANRMVEPVANRWLLKAYENAGFVELPQTRRYQVEVPKNDDWWDEGREVCIPYTICAVYAAHVAAVPGYKLDRSDGELALKRT